MIINDLAKAYDRIAMDEDSEIARDGFCFDKISHYIIIDETGRLKEIIDNPNDSLEKVPENAKKNTTEAWFFIDSFDYILGLENSDGWVEATDKSGVKKFELYKNKNLEFLSYINNSIAEALKTFLKNWIPAENTENENLFTAFGTDKAKPRKFSGRCAFCINSITNKSYTDSDIHNKWNELKTAQTPSLDFAQCGISGVNSEIAKNHAPIKLAGAQGKDAYLISVDKATTAYSSYNKLEAFNGPVSKSIMKKYTSALNYFYRKDSKNKTRLGNDTVIFWAECDNNAYQDDMLSLLGLSATESEEETIEENVVQTVHQIKQGIHPNNFNTDDNTKFHLLMLAPNSARLTVHRYYNTTFGELRKNVEQHNDDMRLSVGLKSYPMWKILDATITSVITKQRGDSINPTFNTSLFDAVLNNKNYPLAIFARMIEKIKTDHSEQPSLISLTQRRISFIKAYIVRNDRLNNKKENITMALNKENKDVAYLLGRLFAVMEKAQQDAIPGANTTIKDRFFASACSTPVGVFPSLLMGYQNHVSKLDSGGIRYEKLVQEIISMLSDSFPKQLDLDSQGKFIIGYYQQRTDLWAKKTTEEVQ